MPHAHSDARDADEEERKRKMTTKSGGTAGKRISEGKMAATASTAAAARGPVYGEKRRTSASSVSPFNSHRCPSSVLGACLVLLSPPTLALSQVSLFLSLFPCSLFLDAVVYVCLLLSFSLFLSFSYRSSLASRFSWFRWSPCFVSHLAVPPSAIPLVRSPISPPSSGQSP